MYACIERESEKYSVTYLCDIYNVSRSGYYKWLKRKGQRNSFEIRWERIDYYVKNVHSHYPDQGYRTLADTLHLYYGISLTDNSVWKSLKRLGIKGFVRTGNKHETTGSEHAVHPNVLNRNFHADMPMQKVATDVTYLKWNGSWYYLALYLDLFNNEVIDWELSDTFDNFLVINPAKRILEKRKSTATPILFHSDQGVQYSSAGYCSLLKSYNVIQSMSRAGTPRDNAVIESFFGRFKDVMRSRFGFPDCNDLFDTVRQTVHYFNYIRPVRKLKRKPPVLFRLEQTA